MVRKSAAAFLSRNVVPQNVSLGKQSSTATSMFERIATTRAWTVSFDKRFVNCISLPMGGRAFIRRVAP